VTHQITLYLDDIQHLFNAPGFDLSAAHPRTVSGIDTIFAHMRLHLKQHDFKATLILPSEQITPDLAERVHAGLRIYARQKIEQADQELASRHILGTRSLLYGIGFLAVCLLIAVLAQQATFLPNWLSGLISNAFTIIGSVSLWHPAESFLFDWFPPTRDKLIYSRVEKMDIEIKAA